MGGNGSKEAENNDGDKDKSHPDNQTLKHEGWEDFQDKPRSCTDILLTILLILVWLAMTIVGFGACGIIKTVNIKAGNPQRLIRPMDYSGR